MKSGKWDGAAYNRLRFQYAVVEPSFTAAEVERIFLTHGASVELVLARVDEISHTRRVVVDERMPRLQRWAVRWRRSLRVHSASGATKRGRLAALTAVCHARPRVRTAARRAAGIRSGEDPGEGDPDPPGCGAPGRGTSREECRMQHVEVRA
jgi:hypothetical protein